MVQRIFNLDQLRKLTEEKLTYSIVNAIRNVEPSYDPRPGGKGLKYYNVSIPEFLVIEPQDGFQISIENDRFINLNAMQDAAIILAKENKEKYKDVWIYAVSLKPDFKINIPIA